MNKTEIVVLLIVKHLCIQRDIILVCLIPVIFLTFSHRRPHPFAIIQETDLTEVCELCHRSLSHIFFCPLERKIKDVIAIKRLWHRRTLRTIYFSKLSIAEVYQDFIDNTCYFLLIVLS